MLALAHGSRRRPPSDRPGSQYQIATLPNGLTVVLEEDHSTPIVHLQLWYHVGSKNEKPGRTGFAHLFEHLMFKGSKNVEPEGHTSMIASVGGQSNAYTTDDETVFWETVPSQYLPLVLWLEADRMATLRIDKDTFTNERDVVKEERRMRIDNQPYGRLNEIIYDQAFTAHPVQAPDDRQHGGSRGRVGRRRARLLPHVLRARERDAGARRRLRFGAGAAARQPVSRPRAEGREAGAARHSEGAAADGREARDAAGALAAAGGRRRVSHHVRRPSRLVSAAHRVKVLSDGQSSRIYKKLVYDTQLAVAAFGGPNLIEDPNLFYAVAIVQPGHTPEEAADALIAEFDRLKAEPITEHELQRAKNQFARDYILGRESNQQKARQLAHAVVIHHDIKTADGEFDIFQSMTAADVQRVARTYFTAGEPPGPDADAVGKAGGDSDADHVRATEAQRSQRR